jgi:hypothetical protein
MAPGGAAAQGGSLPSLADMMGGAGGAGAAQPQAGANPAAAAATGGGGAGIGALAGSARWMGPLLTIGGGAMAYRGITRSLATPAAVEGAVAATSKMPSFLKWGGIAAAIGGIALTGLGFKAKGVADTTVEATAALNTMQQQAQAQQQQIIDAATQKISEAQSQSLPSLGGGAGTTSPIGGTGATGATGTTPTSTVPAGMTIDPTTGQPVPAIPAVTDPNTGDVVPGTGGTPAATNTMGLDTTVVPGATGAAPAAATPGVWSVQSLVGSSVSLAAGTTASGAVIADAGNYQLQQPTGDPNGYASVAEANAAARQTMSTELMGSKFLRWMVVEHGGRYYGVIAKQLGAQEPAKPLTADLGNVVAWSAMNHVDDNGKPGWHAYSWTKDGGSEAIDVPYGTSNVFGAASSTAGGGPIGASTSTSTPAATTATTGTAPSGPVTGGGPTGAFDPASEVGRTFSVNAANTAEGDLVRGGVLQVQKFVETSTGGFGSPEDAAAAARAARTAAGGGDQWKRWVSLQGADGRFYVYEGSIVKRPTADLQDAAPVHVFGSNTAEYFDDASNAWHAVRDAS